MRLALARSLVVLLAVGLDLAAGEPPSPCHPVAWIGAALARGRRALCRGSAPTLLVAGGSLTLGVAAAAGFAGWLIADGVAAWPVAALVVDAIVLKACFALRGLAAAALAVGDALARGDLDGARRAVGRDLVSRPTSTLDGAHVAAATIESVAENLTDSFVAPVAFYLAFGLPGALVYRVVNTADAMFGYRVGALEHFGKVPARLDDALNFVPARLAAGAIVVSAALLGGDGRAALAGLRRDRRCTASPNAGWTMAAMAGALRVRLEKPGSYRLGAGFREPGADDVVRAVRIMGGAAVLVLLAQLAAELVR